MDQQTVESLLRRLVERVEESERRYGEALEELHARLDQLSQTTDAARAASAPEDAATLGRLHDHVSTLARRLEQEASTPLDDFERIGKALSAGMEAPQVPESHAFKKLDDPFATLDDPFKRPEGLSGATTSPSGTPQPVSAPTFDFPLPETTYSVPPVVPPASASASLEEEDRALDKRLVDIAHQLEHSIGTAIPATAIEALNARLDEIYTQLSEALNQTAKRDSLEHVERQLAEMSQQIGRAEVQLAKMGSIESQLLKLIERVDAGAPELEDLATKAASEAIRRAGADANPDTARVEAIERDLAAMSEKTKASDERIASTLAAVHDSIKHLVQQVERGAGTLPPRPRLPFADRQGRPPGAPLPPQAQPGVPQQGQAREGDASKAQLPPVPPASAPGAQAALPKIGMPRNGAPGGAPAEDIQPAGPFGRAKPAAAPREEAVDLDKAPAPRPRRMPPVDAEYEVPDDLVAAARRAAQAVAAKAAERTGGSRLRRSVQHALPGSAETETQPAKKRPILMIAAAVLLVLSALLLYGRLKSKPEPEVTAPPAVEQTVPAPGDQSQETPAPPAGGQSQAAPESGEGTPPAGAEQYRDAPAVEKSGSWDPEVMEEEPAENALGEAGGTTGTTEIAKSPRRAEAPELTPAPELVSLKSNDAPALPPGVVFSIQEPAANAAMASAQPGLLLPAETVGPASLREAAATGNAAAQYVVALRYLKSENAAEAVRWLERAASGGLAPAQYRLGAMYERGQGVTKDFGRARSWYQSAAEKGNVKAMHNLAVSASAREGGTPDYAVAAKWYGEAASYGLPDSQFNLGVLAEHGLGQQQDSAAAYKWFSLAAQAGDKEAATRRTQVKAKLDAASLAAAEEAVKTWHPKAANPDANDVEAKAEWGEPVAASSGPQKENVALVSRAQALLNKLGYDAGSPDGVMGERTRAAIKSFERKSGLLETGDVTIQLVTHLERAAG